MNLKFELLAFAIGMAVVFGLEFALGPSLWRPHSCALLVLSRLQTWNPIKRKVTSARPS